LTEVEWARPKKLTGRAELNQGYIKNGKKRKCSWCEVSKTGSDEESTRLAEPRNQTAEMAEK